MLPVILIITAALLIAFIASLVYIFDTAFYNSKGKRKRQKPFHTSAFDNIHEEIRRVQSRLIEARYEDVYIKSLDGLCLHARYYHNIDDAPVIIMAHGYRSTADNDSGGAYGMFTDRGYNCLIIDQRTHGKSQGHTITFGVKERHDVAGWVEYTAKRFGKDTPIILMGVSMGASTVMMCSDLELKGNVQGIIADCGFTSAKDIISLVMKNNMGLNPRLCYPMVRIAARLLGSFDPDSASALEAVKNSRIPILIIHGDADTFVPYYMGERLYEVCSSRKEFLCVKGADHGISFIVGYDAYYGAVDKFLTEIGAK